MSPARDENAILSAQLAAMTAERQKLAEAICGGEDYPGYLAAQTVDDLVKVAKDNTNQHGAVIDMMMKAEAERDALVGAANGMVRIVEEIDGAMNHGAWRDEKGMRLKDTPEWVALYLAVRSPTTALDHMLAQAKAEGRKEGMREAAEHVEQRAGSIPDRQEIASEIRALAAAEKEAQ